MKKGCRSLCCDSLFYGKHLYSSNTGLSGRGNGGCKTFFEKKVLHSKKLQTIGVAELYKAKVAGQSSAALTAPANALG